MGREIKRVDINFKWPLNKVWAGYFNPWYDFYVECESCKGDGFGPEAKVLMDKWYGKAPFYPSETGSKPFDPYDSFIQEINRAKMEHDRQFYVSFYNVFGFERAVFLESVRMCQIWNASWGHHLSQEDVNHLFEKGFLRDFETLPTAEEVNRWSLTGFGLSGTHQYSCVKRLIEEKGVSLTCAVCNGEGRIWPMPEIKEKCESWERIEPPQGDGWQMWETVSEGSPVSPVFSTSDELEEWLIGQGYSEGAAEQFVKTGWAPSLALANGHVYKNIETLNIAED